MLDAYLFSLSERKFFYSCSTIVSADCISFSILQILCGFPLSSIKSRYQCYESSQTAVTAAIKQFVDKERTINACYDSEERINVVVEMGEVHQYLNAQGLKYSMIKIDGERSRGEIIEETTLISFV